MNAIARRAFSSRSAIRAPPAPSSAVSMAAAPRTVVRSGRVAMLPKATEPVAAPASASHVSTSAAVAQDVYPQVGTIAVAGEQPNIRLGDSN